MLAFCLATSIAVVGLSAKRNELPPNIKHLLEDLSKIIEKVNAIDPNKDTYMVGPSEVDWLLRAVSMKARERWSSDFFKSGASGKLEFFQKLDELSRACAKNIPGFIPDPSNFASRNEANEIIIKKALPNIGDIKIIQIGFAQDTWDIQTDKLGKPQRRSLIGYIWGKDKGDDFVYCRLYQVKIFQENIGNGKFSESKAVLLDSWLVGCR